MSEVPVNEIQKHRKRKKKSFFQNAKGFAKKGCYGRGTEVDQDTYNYFLNIMDVLREPNKELEDKVILANNALEDQIEGEKILNLSANQICSRAIENLLPFTDPELYENILSIFSKDVRVSSSGEFTSHIIEKLLDICLLRSCCDQIQAKKPLVSNDELTFTSQSSFTEDHRNKCRDFIIKVSKFCLNNLEEFSGTSSCYVIRKCLLCLAGIYKIDSTKKSGIMDKNDCLIFGVDDSCSEIVTEFVDRITQWPQFSDLPYVELSSGLLQNLSLALKYTNKNSLKSFGKQILNKSFLLVADEDDNDEKKEKMEVGEGVELPPVFTTEASIRLLETLISVAGPKLITQLNCMLFTGKLKQICEHRSANFALQRLLQNVKETSEFEKLFEELEPLVEEILQIGYTGVVLALGKACERLKTKQGQFIQIMQKALKCEKNSQVSFFICVTKLKPATVCAEDNTTFVHLHGSLIVQSILNFNKPIKFIQNMLELKSDTLVKIFCDPKGSHIVDAFVKSKSVGEQSKIKLAQQLEGQFLKMALSKHGSQALEALFQQIPLKSRQLILEELSENFNQLNGSSTGQIISKKLHIEVYKRHGKNRWETSFEKNNKIEKLFENITS